MKEIVDFLQTIAEHNDRQWFLENRPWYDHVQNRFNCFAQQFIDGIARFDIGIKQLQLKDATYRIYRDMRFHKGAPYKTHMGVYVCPEGKKSGYAGYYIHIQPSINEFSLYSGLYNPTAPVLRNFREVFRENTQDFIDALDQCREFKLPWDKAYKRFPKNFFDDGIYSRFYRLRSLEIRRPFNLDEVLDKNFINTAIKLSAKTYAYNKLLNACVDRAKVEAMTMAIS